MPKRSTLHRRSDAAAAAAGPTAYSGVASIAAASALGLAVSCSYWAVSTWGDGAGDLSGAAAEMERLVAAAYKDKSSETAIPRLPMCRWQLAQYLIDCVTAERFAAEFHNKKTVIISGVVTERELRSWSLDAVIAEHGRASLAMTIGGALPVQNEGGGAAVRIALESARTRMLADPRLVVFDTSTTPDAARIAAQVPTPVVIADALSSGANEALWKPFFSMMAPGLGLPTHRHGETWSVLLDGRKRWFVSPAGWSGTPLPPPFLNTSAWLTHVLRGALPRTALQQPGDVLYVPTDTAHATFNLRESLLIGRQRIHGGGDGNEAELDALEEACFPNRPASLTDGQGDANACVMQGHRHAQPALAAPAGQTRNASLGVGAFFYQKADLAAARCARCNWLHGVRAMAERHRQLWAWRTAGVAQRARMLQDSFRALRRAEGRWRKGRGPGLDLDEVAPLLAAAYTKLAQAANAPSEAETRTELRKRAAALVEADDPTIRQLAIGAAR